VDPVGVSIHRDEVLEEQGVEVRGGTKTAVFEGDFQTVNLFLLA
jgi:hypothetical protein